MKLFEIKGFISISVCGAQPSLVNVHKNLTARLNACNSNFQDIIPRLARLFVVNQMCGYQDLNLGPRHYQCRALTN